MSHHRLRGAVVGFGQVAEYGHWPAFRASSDFEIVAIVERSAGRRSAARELCPGIRTVATLDDLATDSIDFVDICTPPALHGESILKALSRGWHVLSEKPFVLDLTTFGAIRDAAVAAGRAVLPVHNWKYAPIIRRATTLLQEGVIGPLRRVAIETLRLKDCVTADPDRPNWRRDPRIAGGGILMDHGWHAMYLTMHWFEGTPLAVGATLHRPATGEAEDEARVRLKFAAGEAEIFLSWNADVRRNAMVLTGEGGEIVVGDGVLDIHARGTDGRIAFASPLSAGSYHSDWFTDFLPDLRRAFEDPAASRVQLDEAGCCLATIQRAYESAEAIAAASAG